MRSVPALALLMAAVAGMVAIAGCQVEQHDQGKGDDVKIATPFGGFSVKTDGASVLAGIGIASYPGAVPEKKDKGKDDAADLNLSFGNFHLGVKALSFTTPDSPEKVLAFYRKDLARFGAVIDCRGHQPVGTPTRTPEGLTCESEERSNQAKLKINDDDYSEELKAGSKQRQHIVAVEARGSGTKFGLVALDLPEGLGRRTGADGSENRQ